MCLENPKSPACGSYEGMDDCAAWASQGHLYRLGDTLVLSMENGETVNVRPKTEEWLGDVLRVSAQWLTPEPMRYHKGELP